MAELSLMGFNTQYSTVSASDSCTGGTAVTVYGTNFVWSANTVIYQNFANNAKAEIRKMCSKDPKPSGCEGLDPKYLQ